MQYKNVESDLKTQSTVGIEGPQGLSGLQVIFNTEYLTNELAITFSPPLMGTVEPGATVDIPVIFSTEELETEVVYTSDIIISSNDPVTPEVLIPVTLNVLSPPEVVSFTLINAKSNEEIGPLTEGMMIDLDDYSANSFSVLANIGTADVGSIVFDFNDIEGYQTENITPYALNGDFSGGTKYYPVEFPIGVNTITATPYSGRNGSGDAGTPLTISFEVFRTNTTEIVSFTLINTDTNQEIGTLNEGDIIDLNDYHKNKFSVIANIGDIAVGSVVFDFNGEVNFQTENIAPYALNGDYKKTVRQRRRRYKETRYYPVQFQIGTNTITATPYSKAKGIGEIGNALTVNFEVVDSSLLNQVEVIVSPNPVLNYTTVSLKGKASKLSGIVYDLSGNIVHKSIIPIENGQGNGQINMSGLRQGIYILQIINNKGEIISQVKILKI